MNRIDQLFKNKLAEHRLAPPPHSWEKIEAGRVKKNSLRVWRMAAGLALFGLLASAWYWNTSSHEVPVMAKEEIPAVNQTPEPDSEPQQPVLSHEKNKAVALKPKPIRKAKEHQADERTRVDIGVEGMPQIPMETTLALEIIEPPRKSEKPIVIEFVLEPVSKSVAVADAPADEGSIKKILDKALEIKNGESDFGSLRNAKNELFALDFRKDKTKRN